MVVVVLVRRTNKKNLNRTYLNRSIFIIKYKLGFAAQIINVQCNTFVLHSKHLTFFRYRDIFSQFLSKLEKAENLSCLASRGEEKQKGAVVNKTLKDPLSFGIYVGGS